MNDEERKKLTKRYRALKGFLTPLEKLFEQKVYYVSQTLFNQIYYEVTGTINDFGQLIPPFNPQDFIENSYYKPQGLQAYLLRAVAIVETELEEVSAATISGPMLTFPFIKDAKIREIIERDYPELLTAFSSSCKKSSLILAGSIIEAILLDFVQQNLTAALSSSKAAKKDPDLLKWDLDTLIDVSVEIKPELAPIQMMSHTVRKYRNLVHPGVEVRNNMKVELEEAKMAISVLNILHRELS